MEKKDGIIKIHSEDDNVTVVPGAGITCGISEKGDLGLSVYVEGQIIIYPMSRMASLTLIQSLKEDLLEQSERAN